MLEVEYVAKHPFVHWEVRLPFNKDTDLKALEALVADLVKLGGVRWGTGVEKALKYVTIHPPKGSGLFGLHNKQEAKDWRNKTYGLFLEHGIDSDHIFELKSTGNE